MGKLITIEGIDGAGKETQSKLLFKRLEEAGYPVRLLSFPDYQNPSSTMVKMYLAGEFGANANDVSAYQASVLFAIDRFASFRQQWQDFYQSGGIVIADRYTTANMIHQGGKIADSESRENFLNWLVEFEYQIMGLPQPDLTLFLDITPEISAELTAKRLNKSNQQIEKDIHEKDSEHLKNSYKVAQEIISRYHWQKINCLQGQELKSIEAIADDIWRVISPLLEL